MDTESVLREFASQHGIDKKEVDKFLNKFNDPKTIDDLFSMPEDMLNHHSYISLVQNPLRSFIEKKLWCERYMVITLEQIMEVLDEAKEIAEDDGNKEELEYLVEVEQYLIIDRFGSVEYDW